MIYFLLPLLYCTFCNDEIQAQKTIPMDTSYWSVNASGHVWEKHLGKDAIYLQGGSLTLKNASFINGIIEYDIHLQEKQGFPGVFFRFQDEESSGEQFYLRPHQSGNPDATQAVPRVKGIASWQLYHGDLYSFPYVHHFDSWTHVKLVVKDDKAQVFLDYSPKPNLSWHLSNRPKEGGIFFTGGNRSGMHLANISVSFDTPQLVNFAPKYENELPNGIIQNWEISDKFEERKLEELENLKTLISGRIWQGKLGLEIGKAANISRIQKLNDGKLGNTVFARVEITSAENKIVPFEFGYSDRALVILNDIPLYKGDNSFRSRDYRYLGTIGFFDEVFLPLKQGRNILLIAVSEDMGGWLVTGRIDPESNVKIE